MVELELIKEAKIELCVKRGRMEEAKQQLQELLEAVSHIGEDWALAYASRAAGIYSLGEKDSTKAIDYLQKSTQTWKKLGWPYEHATSAYQLGLAYDMENDRKKASECMNEAKDTFVRLGAKPDIERVLARNWV